MRPFWLARQRERKNTKGAVCVELPGKRVENYANEQLVGVAPHVCDHALTMHLRGAFLGDDSLGGRGEAAGVLTEAHLEGFRGSAKACPMQCS